MEDDFRLKVLRAMKYRPQGVTIRQVADSNGVDTSTIYLWRKRVNMDLL
jgi:transposase